MVSAGMGRSLGFPKVRSESKQVAELTTIIAIRLLWLRVCVKRSERSSALHLQRVAVPDTYGDLTFLPTGA
jgi:hypothetical protein